LFHRVIANFMIQAGDPDSKKASPDAVLGSGDVGYSIPAEFVYPKYYHKKGALAAAREGDNENPQKASSGCQFYIVKGKVFTDAELDAMEKSKELKLESQYFKELLDANNEMIKKMRDEKNQEKLNAFRDSAMTIVRKKIKENPTHKFSIQQRTDYKTIGGTPHLDGSYTVFGEVVEGLDIVVNISNVKTGEADRPVEDVRILKAKRIK
ncbi:MAG: peptidylprolyl isomerase, partial [Paludibacter sp.]